MNKLICLCALGSVLSFTSYGQQAVDMTTPKAVDTKISVQSEHKNAEPVGSEESNTKATKAKVDNEVATLQKKVGFSKEQYPQVYDIEYRYQSSVDSYPKNSISAEMLNSLVLMRDKEMQSVLLPSQYSKYLEAKKDVKK